jgi:hypothetical protein
MKRKELQQYIGNQAQLGGSRHYILSEGWGRNLRAIDVNSGSGLQYTILPDRGMDISLASYKGANLVYLTCNGETHPAFFEPENFGWLHTFTGGLLTTCGLTYLGSPVTDDGEQLGLHGRYSTIPAKQVSDSSEWIGDEYFIKINGIVEEGHMFGNKLRMEREIVSVLGQNKITITDRITNFGNKLSPYTILYHMNLGYPLLDEDAELIIDPVKSIPRDDSAASGIKEFKKFCKPTADFREQVFDHVMSSDDNGNAIATIQNARLGIALSIKFKTAQLPYMVQWKMMGQGEYVLGLEPCNIPGKNRRMLKEENILPLLKPGESSSNTIVIEVTEIK